MSSSRDPHPERSLRKKPMKRFFKDLVMPEVRHTKGEVPEEFQPKSDARSARFAVLCCAMAVMVFSSWIGFVRIRKALRNRAMQNTVCCGCGQQQSRSSCAKNATCSASGAGHAGCHSTQVPPARSPNTANSNP